MDFSLSQVLIVIGVSVSFRLAVLYLDRLDQKEVGDPEAERRAIAASRRRAQGHLWLLGALMTSLFLLAFLFSGRPLETPRLLVIIGLALADAICFRGMVGAYKDARRKGSPTTD